MRPWKANASEKLGIIDSRERAAMKYHQTLKERWKVDAQVGRISRYVAFAALLFFFWFDGGGCCKRRHISKPVLKTGELKRTMVDAARVKEDRRHKHSRAGVSARR